MSVKQQGLHHQGDGKGSQLLALHEATPAPSAPVAPNTTHTLLYLQRRYGNAYVQRLLAKRGTIDAVALHAELTRPAIRANKIPPTGLEEEEEGMARPDRLKPSQSVNDPGLVIGAAGDAYEQEADQVATQVAATTSTLHAATGEVGMSHVLKHMAPEDEMSRLFSPTGVQKMEIAQSLGSAAIVVRVSSQRGSTAAGDVAVPAAIGARIIQSKGEGTSLPDPIRRSLEAQMGHDFGPVRVKQGVEAASLCQQLGARAFTHGRDIWLGRGESIHDIRLMAHELTHVVQQKAAMPINPKHIIERVDLKRETIQHFQTMIWRKTGDVALYRRKLFQFQRRLSRETVDRLQSHLLGSPDSVAIRQQDNPQRLRAIYGGGGGGGVPRQFPTINEAARDPRVSAARDADWTAAQTDYAERFAWITWDSSNNTFNVAGRATGTWQGVTPGAKPADAGTVYHAGEYHQHPPLPPAQRPNTASFPVGPSAADTNAANADNSPGIVRDFTSTARTTVRDYTYGPARRSGRPA